MKLMVRPKNEVEVLHDYMINRNNEEEVEDIDLYDEEDNGWELIESKLVEDPMDGFMTDYSLWYNNITDEWVTIFGDNEMYTPSDTIADMEFGSNEDEARYWFENYSTEEDEEWL